MIVVHIPHDAWSEPYTRYCFEAMQRQAQDPNDIVMALHVCPGHPLTAADDHSRAVGEAFSMTATRPDDIHVICDSDTVVVMPHWDAVLRQLLDTYDCVGTAYQRMGTVQTGHGRKQTYKDKPNVEWLALKPGKPWHQFVPAQTNQHHEPVMVLTRADEALWNLPIGCQLLQDTCWNFPPFLRDNQLTSYAFTNVEPREYVALRGFDRYEEWHLDGVPFVVHQGKSRKVPFRGVWYSTDFYDRCDQLLTPPTPS